MDTEHVVKIGDRFVILRHKDWNPEFYDAVCEVTQVCCDDVLAEVLELPHSKVYLNKIMTLPYVDAEHVRFLDAEEDVTYYAKI